MTEPQLSYRSPVTLVGGGDLDAETLAAARRLAPTIIAADGAADTVWRLGLKPAAIIGDLDSLRTISDWHGRNVAIHHLEEQETTDFEKCLYTVAAPFYVAVGFLGRRHDHALAVLSAMVRYPEKRVVLAGATDVIVHLPGGAALALDLPAHARVSIFPIAEVECVVGEGLAWPTNGLKMAPGGRIGTSNAALGGRVRLAFDRDGALIFLDADHLPAVIQALSSPER